jgi:hypothetical protein
MKKCSKCEKEKEAYNFYKSKRQKDGLYPSCKDCEISRSLDYYNNNKEEQLERKKDIIITMKPIYKKRKTMMN